MKAMPRRSKIRCAGFTTKRHQGSILSGHGSATARVTAAFGPTAVLKGGLAIELRLERGRRRDHYALHLKWPHSNEVLVNIAGEDAITVRLHTAVGTFAQLWKARAETS